MTKYYVSLGIGDWIEISRGEYMAAARAAGALPPNRTDGSLPERFTGNAISGYIQVTSPLSLNRY
jgi:hypothetical protein